MSVLEAPFRLPEAPACSDLVAKYFRGLGDATRVRILELLRDEGELSVGELVERLPGGAESAECVSDLFRTARTAGIYIAETHGLGRSH